LLEKADVVVVPVAGGEKLVGCVEVVGVSGVGAVDHEVEGEFVRRPCGVGAVHRYRGRR
jgi:hypothetical protein